MDRLNRQPFVHILIIELQAACNIFNGQSWAPNQLSTSYKQSGSALI